MFLMRLSLVVNLISFNLPIHCFEKSRRNFFHSCFKIYHSILRTVSNISWTEISKDNTTFPSVIIFYNMYLSQMIVKKHGIWNFYKNEENRLMQSCFDYRGWLIFHYEKVNFYCLDVRVIVKVATIFFYSFCGQYIMKKFVIEF